MEASTVYFPPGVWVFEKPIEAFTLEGVVDALVPEQRAEFLAGQQGPS